MIRQLMEAINTIRVRVWKAQPATFFEEAIIETDGTLVETTGECKAGIDINYKGQWGYHPLVVSLANTGEALYLVNRSGKRPSHEQAAEYFDRAVTLCRRAGFRHIRLRGDTDFTQTAHLDRWHADGVTFVFGIDAMNALYSRVDELPENAWKELARAPRYEVKTACSPVPITPSNRLSSNANTKTFASKRSTSPSSPIARQNVVLRIVSWSCGKISKGG